MADGQQSAQERTEQATSKRVEDARLDGQVARSMEVNSAAVLGAASLSLWFAGPWIFEELRLELGRRVLQIPRLDIDALALTNLLRESAILLLKLTAPVLLTVAAAGLLANIVQVGPLITAKPLMPDASRINPMKGIKNLFSARSLAELVKSLLKIALVGLAVGLVLKASWPVFRLLSATQPPEILSIVGGTVMRVLASALAMLLVLALADFLFQRWNHAKQLRMTVQEIKEERKQTDGNPQVKGRLRGLQMEAAYNRMIGELPTADVVVTNPTHLAVALRYDPQGMRAPKVIAKGRRKLAERIKAIAREHGIPVVENKPLARGLFKACDIGMEIPSDLYRAVAELLAFVWRTSGRKSA